MWKGEKRGAREGANWSMKEAQALTDAHIRLFQENELVGQLHPAINIDQLKLYVETDESPPGPVGEGTQGYVKCVIDKIVDERKVKTVRRGGKATRREYRIRWKVYGPQEDMWEPAWRCDKECPFLIKVWQTAQPGKRRRVLAK